MLRRSFLSTSVLCQTAPGKTAGWLLLLLALPFALALLGCTSKRPLHLYDRLPPLPLVAPADWSTTNRVPDEAPFFQEPSVAVVEFNEGGRLQTCEGDKPTTSCELERAKKFIQLARKQRGTREVTILTFVHGWHHDASEDSDNFRNFSRMVHCLNWGEPGNNNLDTDHHADKRFSQPVICDGIQQDPSKLFVGVYLAWRGESVSRKLGPAIYLSVLDRRNAAARLAAQRGDRSMGEALLQLSRAAKEGNDTQPARFVLVGHSFGGLIVNRVAADLLERRMDEKMDVPPCNDGAVPLMPSFADLVVVVNPADDGLHMADLAARSLWWEKEHPLKACPQQGLNPDSQSPLLNPSLRHPLLVSLHTSSDTATDVMGSVGLKLALPLNRSYMRSMERSWRSRPDQDLLLDDPPTEGTLRSNTLSHMPYLRNLCYLDQPNRQDPVCLGMADKLHEIKQNAYHEVMGDGSNPVPLNHKYAVDPYYHGAYELLTAVCTWPDEDSGVNAWSKEHQFEMDFVSGGACEGKRADNRRTLEQKLRERLREYLAFPQERESLHDDLLLNIYKRVSTGELRCRDINMANPQCPPPCNPNEFAGREKGVLPWNRSPVWTLNVSYEILQSHSGIWNTDAMALILGIAQQFPVSSWNAGYDGLPEAPPQIKYPVNPRPHSPRPWYPHWPWSGGVQQMQTNRPKREVQVRIGITAGCATTAASTRT